MRTLPWNRIGRTITMVVMARTGRSAARRTVAGVNAAGADAVRTPARGRRSEETSFDPIPVASPDAPVRVELAMPRHLFDRLTDRDDGPRCRYDVATGRAEFLAEPTFAHESRGVIVGELLFRIADALEDAGSPLEISPARATRLLSDDGAFEPDEGLFVGAAKIRAAEGIDEWFDVRRGHPIPDLVAEIDRSTASRHKLGPYFRMGVREAWTWSRRSGTALWVADPRTVDGFRRADASVVLPGLSRDALHGLLASCAGVRRRREMRRLAGIVARALAGNPPGAA